MAANSQTSPNKNQLPDIGGQNSGGILNAIKKIVTMRGMGQVISVTAALIVMCIVFGLINANFFSAENTTSLLRQVVPILIIGIGQSYVLITGGIDLSIGSVVGMSTMMSSTFMATYGMNPFLACVFTVFCCCLVGLCNGILISKAKLPAFIATLGTMITVRGIAQRVNGDMNTGDIAAKIDASAVKDIFYYGQFLGISISTWIAVGLFLVFAFVLAKTRTGRHTYAIGSNYEAAKLSGVNVVAAETKVYVISSFLSSIVGLILTAQSGMGAMNAGTGYELNAVAASVIGGVSTMGGQGLLFGTVIGSFIWGVLTNGLQFAGAKLGDRNIIIGIVVVISVLIDRIARGNKGGLKRSFMNGFKAFSKPKK